ncbi:hypothetical protein GQX74_013094 [Glossina fuscipes]|nr:hypothetical protein GQX74_013094 [Glossina fuscipes]
MFVPFPSISLLPSATAISNRASHANQNKLAKRTPISENLSSQHSTRKSSRPHPPATTVTAAAQHSKSCFQPAPQAYINQTPANLASSSRSTMINSELKFSTNTSGGTKSDGSSSRTPFDLATEALRGSRPIDRERLLNLLQRIANESFVTIRANAKNNEKEVSKYIQSGWPINSKDKEFESYLRNVTDLRQELGHLPELRRAGP